MANLGPPCIRKLAVVFFKLVVVCRNKNQDWNLLRRKLNISAQIKKTKRSFFQYFLALQKTKRSENCFWAEFSIFISRLFLSFSSDLLKGHTRYKVAPWEVDGPRKAILREAIGNLFPVAFNLI